MVQLVGDHGVAGVQERVDILTGTFGKALGGASGGYTSGRREIIELLRHRSRPYLFSNSLAPAVVAGNLAALQLVSQSAVQREQLWANAARFRAVMADAGFAVLPGAHAIAPVMVPDAREAVRLAEHLLHEGVYVIAFSYPVVPVGAARIRVQLSASHSTEDVDACVAAFVRARAAAA